MTDIGQSFHDYTTEWWALAGRFTKELAIALVGATYLLFLAADSLTRFICVHLKQTFDSLEVWQPCTPAVFDFTRRLEAFRDDR